MKLKSFHIGIFLILSPTIFISLWAQGSGAVRFLGNFVSPTGSAYVSGCWGWTDTLTGREYAILANECGTSIVEITDANNLVERSFIPGVCSIWREIQVHSHYVYVVSEGGGGTQIINLSNLPASASLVKNFTYTGSGGNTSRAHTIHIRDGYMYLNGGSYGIGGVVIFSLADPENPVYQSAYEAKYFHDCFVRNDTIYGATLSGGVEIVDARVKTNPQLLNRFNYTFSSTHNCATTTDGHYLLTTDETSPSDANLKIWNLQTPPIFPKVAEYVGNPAAIIHNVFVKGNYAYISYYTAGFKAVDITDPTNPIEIGGYDTYSGPDGDFEGAWSAFPFFPSGKVIIGDMTSGLFVFDIAFNAPRVPTAFTSYSDYLTPTSIKLVWDGPISLGSGAPLLNFTIHIYRNGSFIAEVDSGIEIYFDSGLVTHQLYSYNIRAVIPLDSSGSASSSAYAGGHAQSKAPSSFTVADSIIGAVLRWKNPSRQLDDTPLNDLAFVLIYRDGFLIDSMNQSSADTGQYRSYIDTMPGYHYYRLRIRDNETPTNYSAYTDSILGFVGATTTFFEDFESSLENIVRTGTWDTIGSFGENSNHCFTDSPIGGYDPNANTSFILPPVILGDRPILQFSHIAIVGLGDFAFLEISTDRQLSYSRLKIFHGGLHSEWQDGVANEGDWFTEIFDLSAYANKTAVIRFRLITNATQTADGWYVDNIFVGPAPVESTASYNLAPNWNMVSLPLIVSDGRKNTVYPSASSDAFYYDNGYVREDTLKPHKGYWIKFDSATNVSLTGGVMRRDTIDVHEKWNMIGSLSSPVDVLKIQSIPSGIITSSFYTFDGSYTTATRLAAGRAYWVKVSQAGKLILSSYSN